MPTILRPGRWRIFFYSNEGSEPAHVHVECTDDELRVALDDGRKLSVPLEWFPRLLHASAAQRADWRLGGGGEGIHWETLDEDLSVRGLLRGERVRR